jgi:hypothetical protein
VRDVAVHVVDDATFAAQEASLEVIPFGPCGDAAGGRGPGCGGLGCDGEAAAAVVRTARREDTARIPCSNILKLMGENLDLLTRKS